MYNWLVEMGRRGKRSKTLAHFLTRLARIALRNEDGQTGAKDELLEAYRIDTTNVETLMTLGQLHEAEEAWRDALKIYRTMLLQNADQSGLMRRGDIYINLARAHVALEEKPKAKAMLRRGLEEDAEHPDLSDQLAKLED
jgi:golgin subfamily B member 1